MWSPRKTRKASYSEHSLIAHRVVASALRYVIWIKANLRGEYLTLAILSGADLGIAHLRGVNFTQQQLDEVPTCKGAILPQGLICHNNQ